MKFTCLLLLAVLLCNSCFHEVTARSTSLSQTLSRNEIVDESGRLRPRFIDLDFDVLFMIFQGLELTDLTSVALTNSRIASIAGDVFRHKYGDHRVDITIIIPNDFTSTDRWNGDICISRPPNKYIKIKNLQFGLTTLRSLGSGIKKVYLHEKFSMDILKSLTAPLTGVEELSVDLKQNGGNILSFSQLFPNLRRLSLNLKQNVDINFVNCELPKLEHLSVIVDGDAWNQQSNIEGVIQKNGQIKSFEFGGFPTEYIKNVNDLLPGLVNLTLVNQEINTNNEKISFESVKNLELKDYERYSGNEGDPGTVDFLLFPQLESLNIPFTKFYSKWKKFFANHKHLTRLQLDNMPMFYLADFTKELNNLVEVDIDFYEFKKVDNVAAFLKNQPNLMKAHFHSGHTTYLESYLESYLEPLANEWKIEVFNVIHVGYSISHFVLERKN